MRTGAPGTQMMSRPGGPAWRALPGGWLALAAVALAGISGGALVGAAWRTSRSPSKRARPRRPRLSVAPSPTQRELPARAPAVEPAAADVDGDMDGLPTGELRRPGPGAFQGSSVLDDLPYVDLVVSDAPGHRNHDRRHGPRPD